MPSIPPMPVVLAAVAGALAVWAGVIVTILMVLWNKLDKWFDELKAKMQEMGADARGLGEKRLSIKA